MWNSLNQDVLLKWSDMSQNAKQQTLWFMNSNVTNGGNFLGGVWVAHARRCANMKTETVTENMHVCCRQ
jgi:hypothetical protein